MVEEYDHVAGLLNEAKQLSALHAQLPETIALQVTKRPMDVLAENLIRSAEGLHHMGLIAQATDALSPPLKAVFLATVIQKTEHDPETGTLQKRKQVREAAIAQQRALASPSTKP